MSEDPKGFDAGDYNLFRYVGNDPLDLTDPMGLDGMPKQQFLVNGNDQAPPGDLVLPIGSNIPVRAVVSNGQLVDYRAAGGLSLAQSFQAMTQGGLHMGQISQQGKSASSSSAAARIEREMGPKRAYTYINKDGVKVYQVDIIWTLKLFNKDGSKAANIAVNETLSPPRNAVGFSQQIATKNNRTNAEGLATDIWGFGFSRPDGQVTNTQTISGPLGTAKWDQTIHANGDFDGPYRTFFHD